MRRKQIHISLENRFGDLLFSKKNDYEISLNDMYDAFEIFNEFVFNRKLNVDEVEIVISQFQNNKTKGNAGFGKNRKPTAKYMITLFKSASNDNFYNILNVLAHEMIHVYDYKCGDIYRYMQQNCNELLSGFYIVEIKDRQYVGSIKYDAHGKLFHRFADKFNEYGFNVEEEYNMASHRRMPKLKDSEKHNFFNETEESLETLTYKAVKKMFDSIDAPGKRLVYRSAKQWYIEFP